MSKQKPILIAITSDQHAGSTVGVCPPEGVRLDDGGTYHPSKPQLWLWECWESYWEKVARFRKETKSSLWAVFNGDLVDGDHHGTHQIISRNPDAQHYVAKRVFDQALARSPVRKFVVRGTEAHVGSGGSAEEALAKLMQAERDEETHTWSRWRLRLNVYGKRLDFQHHGRMGNTPWTRPNNMNALAAKIYMEHTLKGLEHPHIAVRSHVHQVGDSHDAFPTRVLITPSWQLKTGFVHKVVPEAIADVGGIMILIQPDGEVTVVKDIYTPLLPKEVRHD